MDFIENKENLEFKIGDFILFDYGVLAIVCSNDERITLATLNDGYILESLYSGKSIDEVKAALIREGSYIRVIKSENILIKEV
jgi:hypothetical protein